MKDQSGGPVGECRYCTSVVADDPEYGRPYKMFVPPVSTTAATRGRVRYICEVCQWALEAGADLRPQYRQG